METGQATNVESADARLTLGAALLVSVIGRDIEGKVSELLSGVSVDQNMRERMVASVDRLLGDGDTMNLDLSDADLKVWTDGLLEIRSKLAAIG